MWKSNIKLQFVQAESNLELSSIIIDVTKYNNLVATIDPEMMSAMSDNLLHMPMQDKYTTLKERLLQEFFESKNKQIWKLLLELQLHEKKHTICYEKCSSWLEVQIQMNFKNHCGFRGSQQKCKAFCP